MRKQLQDDTTNGVVTDRAPTSATKLVDLGDVVHELRALRAALAHSDAELMTAGQASRFLGVGKTKLYQLAALDERLKPVKLPGAGKRWRRTDLETFVKSLGE